MFMTFVILLFCQSNRIPYNFAGISPHDQIQSSLLVLRMQGVNELRT